MDVVDSIIGAESGGNPNAKNPLSSASGLGQFIDSTWLSVLREARPDIAQGKSDAELIALKSDPNLSREMTGVYAAKNGAILTNAGHSVTPGNTYLAHFAGPGGAVSVLNADPSAPVSSVLAPSTLQSNPFLRGMTVGELRAWADRKVGGAGAAPARPAGPLNAIPQPTAPLFAQPQQPQQPQQMAQTQQAPEPAGFDQIPMGQAPPIFFPPRKQIDLSKLRAAFKQPNFYRG